MVVGMSEQYDLLDYVEAARNRRPPESERRELGEKTLKFLKYHRENPHVYDLFKKFSRQVLLSGHAHYSARAVFDRIRWYTTVETECEDGFKISNNHSPFYARMLIKEDERFAGFFRNKRAEADDT
jgi:hypothetical protein